MSHSGARVLQKQEIEEQKRIVLVGNPNAGKSAVFNALTGLYVDVSNYPGTTLDISHCPIEHGLLIDTPGVYGISSFNDEERIARDIILSADVVINVVNSLYLERDLFLTQQIIDAGIPMVVALNMIDEAEKSGVIIQIDRLSTLLGVPVVPTVGIKRKGMRELVVRLPHASVGNRTPGLEQLLTSVVKYPRDSKTVNGSTAHQNIAERFKLLVLEGDREISQREGVSPRNERELIYRMRREHVNGIVLQVVKDESRPTPGEVISRLSLKPLTGIPLLLAVLWVVYRIMGSFVASIVVGFTEDTVMHGLYEPWMQSLVSKAIALDSALGRILAGEFGVLTMTPIYVFGLLAPLVFGFYVFMALFEDSGYLPRVAALSDRTFGAVGLNGRAIIPLILGFGCVTMATITTRLLATQKEKRIAIFLLGLTVPCSAQLGLISAMLSERGLTYLVLYGLTILTVFLVVGVLLKSVLPGERSSLLIDLPPMRVPSLSNVLKKASLRTYHFISEALPLFAAGTVIVGVMDISGFLDLVQSASEPVVVSWLRLPREAATTFIMGFIRRDFGAAGLSSMSLSNVQAVTAMVTLTLFVPCVASMLVIVKERGKLEAAAMWIGAILIAVATGGVLARVMSLI